MRHGSGRTLFVVHKTFILSHLRCRKVALNRIAVFSISPFLASPHVYLSADQEIAFLSRGLSTAVLDVTEDCLGSSEAPELVPSGDG